jgi:hypothetical protein
VQRRAAQRSLLCLYKLRAARFNCYLKISEPRTVFTSCIAHSQQSTVVYKNKFIQQLPQIKWKAFNVAKATHLLRFIPIIIQHISRARNSNPASIHTTSVSQDNTPSSSSQKQFAFSAPRGNVLFQLDQGKLFTLAAEVEKALLAIQRAQVERKPL